MTQLLDIATSVPVTGIFALLFIGSAAVRFFGNMIPALQPYGLAATLAMGITLAASSFNVGYNLSDSRAEMELIKSQLASKTAELEVQKAAAEFYQKAMNDLKKKDEELEAKKAESDDYYTAPKNGSCAADDEFLRRLHSIK